MRRIDNLTGLRAFAAFWVVLYHLNFATPLQHALGQVVAHGSFGVDIFFVLSGFILSLVYATKLPETIDGPWYRKFLTRRFAKIYPLHLITFLLTVVLVLVGRHMHYRFTGSDRNTLWTAVCNVFLVHSLGLTNRPSWNVPSWSVSAEWFAYTVLFAPMVFLLRRVRVLYTVLLAATLWMVLILVCTYVFKSGIELTNRGALRILPEFVCGYALFRMVQKKTPSYGDLWTFAGVLLLGLISISGETLTWMLMPAVTILLTGLYAGGAISNFVFGNRAAVLLGDASYSIYLVHSLVLNAATVFANRLHVLTGKASFVSVMLLCIVVSGMLTFRYIEEPLRLLLLRAVSATGRNPEAVSPPLISELAQDTQVSSTIG